MNLHRRGWSPVSKPCRLWGAWSVLILEVNGGRRHGYKTDDWRTGLVKEQRFRKPFPRPSSSLLRLTQAHSSQGLRET